MGALILFVILTTIFVVGVKFTEPPREVPRDRRWNVRKPK